MKTKKANKSCRAIRNWLGSIMSNSIGLDADWVQKHIAGCPRCQRRLASTGKVHLALSIIKSRPHKLDLLMRANLGALKMLKHSLRDCPKAQKLKRTLPAPKMSEKLLGYRNSIANVAACIAILFLMKTGVFSFMNEVDSQGRKVVKQYYVTQAGEDLANEIFSA